MSTGPMFQARGTFRGLMRLRGRPRACPQTHGGTGLLALAGALCCCLQHPVCFLLMFRDQET